MSTTEVKPALCGIFGDLSISKVVDLLQNAEEAVQCIHVPPMQLRQKGITFFLRATLLLYIITSKHVVCTCKRQCTSFKVTQLKMTVTMCILYICKNNVGRMEGQNGDQRFVFVLKTVSCKCCLSGNL